MRILFVILFSGTLFKGYSQNLDLKTLIEDVNNRKDDTVKVNMLIQICDSLYRTRPVETIKYATEAHELSQKLNFKKGEAYADKHIGMGYFIQAEYVKAFDYFQQSLDIFEILNNKKGVANMLNSLGTIYNNQGNDAKALEFYLRSLSISEEIGDSVRIVTAQINVGMIYSKKEATNDKAKEFYLKALRLSEKLHYYDAIGTVSVDLGELYFFKGEYEEALSYFENSLKAYRRINSGNVPYTLIYIGKVYAMRKDYLNAMRYQLEALHVSRQTNSKLEEAQALIGLANTYTEQGEKDKALALFKQAEQITKEVGARIERKETYKGIASIYALKRDYQNAFRYQLMESNLKDTTNSVTSQIEINKLQTKYEIESIQKENEILKRDAKLREAKSRLQLVVIFFLFLGVVSISVFLILLFRANAQKKKANEELNQANGNLTTALDTVSAQKKQIEIDHEVITGSIRYARYIQRSVLPKSEQLASSLGDHFIIFKPKEIVSGDFYWVCENGKNIIIVAADCTGHGVPGAFMSMLGITLLNEIVKKDSVTNPGIILDRLRAEVIESLKQNGINGEAKDGMDISLCCIDFENMKLQYAGAINPLYLIRETGNERIGVVHDESTEENMMIEIKGDPMPIGINDDMNSFTFHEINICKGDRYYLSSDGFHDQFGGPNRKKFSYKQFREQLIKTRSEIMCDQKSMLEQVFDEWKGDNDQTDDILVIGFRVN